MLLYGSEAVIYWIRRGTMGHDNQLSQIHRVHGLLRHVCSILDRGGVLFVGLSKYIELVFVWLNFFSANTHQIDRKYLVSPWQGVVEGQKEHRSTRIQIQQRMTLAFPRSYEDWI